MVKIIYKVIEEGVQLPTAFMLEHVTIEKSDGIKISAYVEGGTDRALFLIKEALKELDDAI